MYQSIKDDSPPTVHGLSWSLERSRTRRKKVENDESQRTDYELRPIPIATADLKLHMRKRNRRSPQPRNSFDQRFQHGKLLDLRGQTAGADCQHSNRKGVINREQRAIYRREEKRASQQKRPINRVPCGPEQ